MSKDILKQTAVHEIGHVIMAYYYNYSVNYTSIDKAIPGEGVTQISWKPDHRVINLLTNPNLANERKSLITVDNNYLIKLCTEFITIMAAGTAAELIFEMKTIGSTNVENINGDDNDIISTFIDSLRSIGFEIDELLVNDCFQIARGLFAKESLWNALDYLSDLLVANQSHRLDKTEIENYLNTADLIGSNHQ